MAKNLVNLFKRGGKVSNNSQINWLEQSVPRLQLMHRDVKIPLTETETYHQSLERPDNYIKFKDPRKIRATTGNPLKSTERKDASIHVDDLHNIVSMAKRYGVDPYEAVARTIVETNGNFNYDNPLHVKNRHTYQSGVEEGISAIKYNQNYAKKLKITNPTLQRQVYNGLGNLYPDTEKDFYNGVSNQAFYGVKIPQDPGYLDMRKQPLYGIEVGDIYNNMISGNKDLKNLIDTTKAAAYTTQHGPLKDKQYFDHQYANGGPIIFPMIGKAKSTDPYIKYNDMIKNKYKKGGLVDVYQLMGMPTPKMYSFGGFLQNTGALIADNTLSIVGAENVADNNNWYAKGDSSTKTFKDISKVTNKIQKAAGQIAATAVGGPMGGAAMGALQNTIGSIDTANKQTAMENNSQWGNIGNIVGNATGIATSLYSPKPTPTFAQGGPIDQALIEVEKGEKLIDQSGKQIKSFERFPRHNEDGSANPNGYTVAPVGSMVLSNRIGKAGKSYSKLWDQAHATGDDLLKKAIINNQSKVKSPAYQAKYGGILRYGGGNIVGNIGNFNPQTSQTPYASWFGAFGQPQVNNLPSSVYKSNPYVVDNFDAGNGSISDLQVMNSSTPQQWNSYATEQAKTSPTSYDVNISTENKNTGNYLDNRNNFSKFAPYATTLGMGLYDAFQKPFSLNAKDYRTNPVKAKYLTGDAGRRDLRNAYTTAKSGINSLVGKVGLYDKYAEQVGKYNENLENQNVGIGNQFTQFNSGIDQKNKELQMNVAQFNEQNKAAKRNAMRQSINDLNTIGQNQKNDEMQKRWLQAAYPNFNFNWNR